MRGGGGATEIIAQARAGLSQIATGSYVGTGTYGQSNPMVINCGFKPKVVILVIDYADATSVQQSTGYPTGTPYIVGFNLLGWTEGITRLTVSTYPSTKYLYFTQTDVGIQFYTDSNDGASQNNNNGITYRYIALG